MSGVPGLPNVKVSEQPILEKMEAMKAKGRRERHNWDTQGVVWGFERNP